MFKVKKEYIRDTIFFLAVVLVLLSLVIQLYLFKEELMVPLSPVFRDTNFTTRLFSEFTPLCLSMILLIWIKKERFEDREDKIDTALAILSVLCSVVVLTIVLRVEDILAMIMYPYALGPTIPSRVWTRVVFYGSISLVLLITPLIFYGKKGLRSMFVTAIIPAFYTFNNDMVVNATKLSSLAFLYPIYSFMR